MKEEKKEVGETVSFPHRRKVGERGFSGKFIVFILGYKEQKLTYNPSKFSSLRGRT